MTRPVSDVYSFAELGSLLAQYAHQPIGAARRALARALLDRKLLPTFSSERVGIISDEKKKPVSILLKEQIAGSVVPGLVKRPLKALPERFLRRWMTLTLLDVLANAERTKSDPRLNLILIGRADAEAWLKGKGFDLGARTGGERHEQPHSGKKATTHRRQQRWADKARKMLATRPGLTLRAAAQRIAAEGLSDGKQPETIRRVLSSMGLKKTNLR